MKSVKVCGLYHLVALVISISVSMRRICTSSYDDAHVVLPLSSICRIMGWHAVNRTVPFFSV